MKSTTPPRQKESHVEEDMNKLSIRDEEESEQFFEITDKTDVQLELKSGSEQLAKDMEKNIVTLSDVGGLDTIIKELVSTINFIFTSQLNGNFCKTLYERKQLPDFDFDLLLIFQLRKASFFTDILELGRRI